MKQRLDSQLRPRPRRLIGLMAGLILILSMSLTACGNSTSTASTTNTITTVATTTTPIAATTLVATPTASSSSTTAAISTTTAATTTNPSTTTAPSETNPNTTLAIPVSSQSDLSVTQIVQQVRPAIVQITSEQNTGASTNITRRPSTNSNPTPSAASNSQLLTPVGIGSGIIYDKSGLILTNHHVIAGADALIVLLPSGQAFSATVVGSDTSNDLAVVKINPQGVDLPVAQLGDSSALHIGDGVVAIGNALGLPGGPTVTAGVVSALDRTATEPAEDPTPATGAGASNSGGGGTSSRSGASSGNSAAANATGPQLYGMIQTDAAINPGNSGGALVNMSGRVVGINTLAAVNAEPGVQAENIGFAISINQAKQIAQQIVSNNGNVTHAYLGVSYQPFNAALAQRLNVTVTQGALLTTVVPGSPAATAGLQPGDIITTIDNQKLDGESTLGEVLNNHKKGDTLQLQVVTATTNGGSGQPRTVSVILTGQVTTS